MPQVDAFGRNTQSGNDVMQSQAMDFMLKQALANQAAQVQREGIQSTERLGNRGFDTQMATQGLYSQRAAQESALQKDKYIGETGLENAHGANLLNVQNAANAGNLATTQAQGQSQMGVAGITSAPQMAMANLASTEYGDKRAQIQAEAGLAGKKANYISGIYDEMGGGAPAGGGGAAPSPMGGGNVLVGGDSGGAPRAPAPAAGGFSPRFKERFAGASVGLGEDPNDAAFRDIVKGAISSGQITPDQIPAALAAMKGGDASGFPALQQRGNPAAIKEYQSIMDPTNGSAAPDLKSIDDLVGHNNWVFTDNNKNQMMSIVNNLVSRLRSQHYSEDAIAQVRKEIANRVSNKFNEAKLFNSAGSTSAIQGLQQ